MADIFLILAAVLLLGVHVLWKLWQGRLKTREVLQDRERWLLQLDAKRATGGEEARAFGPLSFYRWATLKIFKVILRLLVYGMIHCGARIGPRFPPRLRGAHQSRPVGLDCGRQDLFKIFLMSITIFELETSMLLSQCLGLHPL